MGGEWRRLRRQRQEDVRDRLIPVISLAEQPLFHGHGGTEHVLMMTFSVTVLGHVLSVMLSGVTGACADDRHHSLSWSSHLGGYCCVS